MDIVVIAADRGAAHPWKRGDLCEVRPAGKEWGSAETLPPADGGIFARVRVLKADGVTPVWVKGDPMPARLQELLDPDQEDTGQTNPDGEPIYTRRSRRIWRAVIDALPAGVRQQLNLTGSYAVQWSTIKAFIENKVSLEQPGDGVVGL